MQAHLRAGRAMGREKQRGGNKDYNLCSKVGPRASEQVALAHGRPGED